MTKYNTSYRLFTRQLNKTLLNIIKHNKIKGGYTMKAIEFLTLSTEEQDIELLTISDEQLQELAEQSSK